MDEESGTVIFQKDADTAMEPASMAKLMTLAVVFNEIRSGRVSLTDEFFVSEHAWRTGGAASGGSTMFAELNSKIPVEDLIRSVIIQSGNDAAIVAGRRHCRLGAELCGDGERAGRHDRAGRFPLHQSDRPAGPRSAYDRPRPGRSSRAT